MANTAAKKSAAPRNPTIAAGIERYSRSRMFSIKKLYAVKADKKKAALKAHNDKQAAERKAAAAKAEAAKTVSKPVGGAKNGKTRSVAVHKSTRSVEPLYESRPLPRNHKSTTAKLRSSITPGTVLILLAGRFRGRRVVFLKQLASGLLLVTGPFKLNGVPLKRVDQSYVIATSTKLPIGDLAVPEHINDAYFKKAEDKKQTVVEFFAEKKSAAEQLPEAKKADQKAVDAKIVAACKSDKMLLAYLKSSFSLADGQYPHLLKF